MEDLFLSLFLFSLMLAYVDCLSAGFGERQDFGTDEAIVEQDVALAEDARRFECQEFRIARTGTDQIQLASLAHWEVPFL